MRSLDSADHIKKWSRIASKPDYNATIPRIFPHDCVSVTKYPGTLSRSLKHERLLEV